MVSDDRHALWNSYFEADFRYRYFLGLKDRLHKRLLRLSLAIALLSAGALTNLLWQVGFGDVLAGIAGAIAGLIGVYLAVSGLPNQLAMATHAATAWGDAARRFKRLWQRAEQGEDVRSEAEALDEQLAVTDPAAIKELRRDKKQELEAFAESEAALSPV